MSGGGGMFTGLYSPEHYRAVSSQSESTTEETNYEAKLNDLINNTLSAVNSRDVDRIGTCVESVKEILQEDLDGTIDTRYGGSVGKHTYVDGLSDVDVLLLIHRTELTGLSPREVLEYVAERIEENPPQGVVDVRVGKMAVTLVHSDGLEIQFVPSIRRGEYMRIPAESGHEWSNAVRPAEFATALTEVNQLRGKRVVPVVKLAKAIISDFPESAQLTGYHVESLAIRAFKDYPDSKSLTTRDMLKYFFIRSSELVKTPIRDPTGQSYYVDDYLGGERSEQRAKVSNRLERVGRRMENADTARSLDEWEDILGGIG
jgi:hypothetical protein